MTDQRDIKDITATATKVVYRNRWMTVREDAIRRRDGSEGIYGVVEKPDFVVIVPLEPDGSLHLVEQYRYPAEARFWELPQGSWEHEPGADPLEVARGELQEETGLVAERMTACGHLFQCYGYSTQGVHIFLAQNLRRRAPRLEQEEQDLVCRRFPFPAVMEMVEDGRIKDATSIAALGLLKLKRLLPP